jgi:hypothetical protein
MSRWTQGARPVRVEPDAAASPADVVWVEVDARHATPEALTPALRRIVGDALTEDMVRDLLDAEPFPKVRRWDEEGCVRSISAFRAVADEGADDREGTAGRLVFQVLEFIAGDGWLISCWHPSKIYVGASEHEQETPVPQLLVSSVEERWVRDCARTAGDLGTLILHFLALSYTDVRRTFHAWLETWELEFFGQAMSKSPEVDEQTLIELRGLIGQFAKRLRATKIPREVERASWFYGLSSVDRAKEVDTMVTRSLEDLNRLGDLVRSAFDLLQLRVAQKQNRASEQLQRRLELVTAVFLAPTLVAGVFGANTAVLGGEGWPAFAVMALLMILGGMLTYVYFERHRQLLNEPDGG